MGKEQTFEKIYWELLFASESPTDNFFSDFQLRNDEQRDFKEEEYWKRFEDI